MNSLVLTPIGVIESPFTAPAGTPVQTVYAPDAVGVVVVEERYVEALADLEGFERIWLLYAFDRAGPWRPQVVPFRDDRERGLFATRAPSRPNPIGLSLVELLGVVDNRLDVRGIDVLDGTPLLDIKPYVPEFDARPDSRAGWLDNAPQDRRRADDRFATSGDEESV